MDAKLQVHQADSHQSVMHTMQAHWKEMDNDDRIDDLYKHFLLGQQG